jgi:hypothetical protein
LIAAIFLSLIVNWICISEIFAAEVELTTKKQLNLEVSPLDISASADDRRGTKEKETRKSWIQSRSSSVGLPSTMT